MRITRFETIKIININLNYQFLTIYLHRKSQTTQFCIQIYKMENKNYNNLKIA